MIKKTPIIKVRPIIGIADSDWDGVPNDEDCVWYDRRRHMLGIGNLMGQIEFLKSGTSGYGPVLGTKRRAEITGKDYGVHHGRAPLTSVDLMYGKKLIMSGKDKGKII